jgi:hypothetical protein
MTELFRVNMWFTHTPKACLSYIHTNSKIVCSRDFFNVHNSYVLMERQAAFSLHNKDLCKAFLTLRITTLSQTFISSSTQQSMMQTSMSCVGSSQVSAYNAVTIFRVNESRDMAPCSTLTLKKVYAAYTKMSKEQKHKMWLTPIAKITKYLQLAKPKDKKHDISCTLTDRIHYLIT